MATERMASPDTAWLHMDQPTNRMVVNSVFWFDARLDWELVRAALLERLVDPFPRFRQRVEDPMVTLGHVAAPQWVDDEHFDIDRHLRGARLGRGGGSAAVQRYVSDHMSDGLPADRPLWEAHLLDVPRHGSVILLRTHHAIADGTALMHVLLTLRDPGADGTVDVPGRTVAPPRRRPSVPVVDRVIEATTAVTGRAARLAGAVAREYAGLVTNPRRLLDVADATRVNAAMLAKLGLGIPSDHTELSGPLGIDKQVRWSRPIDLDLVKTVGRGLGATVNDVMLATLAGGLRRHLAAGGHEVKDVVVIVPYNVRSPDELVTPALGNRFGLVFLRLPATVEGAAERIAQVKGQMDHIKRSDEGAFVYGFLAAAGRTPTQLQRVWIDLFAGSADAVITNIAGPREEVRLTGVPLRGFVAWVPATGPIGVGLSIVSYNGSVVVGVMVDSGVVPDSAGLLRAIEAEIRGLRRLASSQRSKRSAAATPRRRRPARAATRP